jgi:hypothetical protein
MEQRLFLELATLPGITPEWVEAKQGFGFDRAPFEAVIKSIKMAQQEIRMLIPHLLNGKKLKDFTDFRLRTLQALTDPHRYRGLELLTPTDLVSPVAIEAAKNLWAFLESSEHLKECPECGYLFITHDGRKRYCEECMPERRKKYDREYKRFDRWEQFKSDVKEQCKTIDDFLRDPKLVKRAKGFANGYDWVVEQVRAILE